MIKAPRFILGLLFICSFSNPKKIGGVFITYDNHLIEGYKVSIKFKPKVVYYEDHINREFLLPQINSGQRVIAIFKPFENHDSKFYRSKNSFLRKKPFSELDEMTTIDRNKKTDINSLFRRV